MIDDRRTSGIKPTSATEGEQVVHPPIIAKHPQDGATMGALFVKQMVTERTNPRDPSECGIHFQKSEGLVLQTLMEYANQIGIKSTSEESECHKHAYSKSSGCGYVEMIDKNGSKMLPLVLTIPIYELTKMFYNPKGGSRIRIGKSQMDVVRGLVRDLGEYQYSFEYSFERITNGRPDRSKFTKVGAKIADVLFFEREYYDEKGTLKQIDSVEVTLHPIITSQAHLLFTSFPAETRAILMGSFSTGDRVGAQRVLAYFSDLKSQKKFEGRRNLSALLRMCYPELLERRHKSEAKRKLMATLNVLKNEGFILSFEIKTGAKNQDVLHYVLDEKWNKSSVK